MRSLFFSVIVTIVVSGFCFGNFSARSLADTMQPPRPAEGFLNFDFKHGKQDDTLRMIDQQNRESEAGDRSPKTQLDQQAIGRSRAEQMVAMIKDEEMQKALVKVTARGKQVLEENPEIKSPLGVLAGAASLWYGRTVRLLKGDEFKAWSRVEARGRSGEVWLQSPILNGSLRFSGGDGVSISMNRSISSINSQAELNYNMQNQSFSSQIRHQLAPNLDFTFGASKAPAAGQTDGRAGVQYHLNF